LLTLIARGKLALQSKNYDAEANGKDINSKFLTVG
jgi:hypothetical protein